MDNTPEEKFIVLVNEEEQYSLWPSFKEVPLGWTKVLNASTKAECQEYVRKVWIDMRPKSLRQLVDA